MKTTKYEIKKWMLINVDRFIDKKTSELNCTSIVEAWDIETQDGGATTDPDHPAWEVAVDVAKLLEDYKK